METLEKYAALKLREEFDNTNSYADAIEVIDRAIKYGLKSAAKDMANDFLADCQPGEEIPFKNHFRLSGNGWVLNKSVVTVHEKGIKVVEPLSV